MAKTVQTLVEVIEARARERLSEVLMQPMNKHFAEMQMSELLPLIATAKVNKNDELVVDSGSHFYTKTRDLHCARIVFDHLMIKHLPSYIEEETKALLTRIDDLETRIGEFENVLSYVER